MKLPYIILIFVLFTILFPLWGFYVSVKPPKITSALTPQDLGMSFEEVWFETEDNLRLHGWLVPSRTEGFIPNLEEDVPTLILLHGYPADKSDILFIARSLSGDFNLFLFDFRYLGQSEGSYSTAGAKEVKDLEAALSFLEGRGVEEVGVWGFSVGGAVALMSAHDNRIKAIVSDSSYASLNLMAQELYRPRFLGIPFGFVTSLWARIILGIDPKEVSPARAVEGTEKPVLVIHSEDDDVIPFSHFLKIKDSLESNSEAVFWVRQDRVHGEMDMEYEERIRQFFLENL